MNCFVSLCILAANLSAADFDWRIPKGFPLPPVPVDNPITSGKVELGRYLFYDKRMSVNGKSSCATCHKQELAFTDGRAQAQGTTGELHPRSAMSLVNVAYAPSLTWISPAPDSLEQQALVPMLGDHPIELGLKGNEPAFLNVLKTDPLYQRLYPSVFADYTLANVTRAIASFERSIVSMRSPYDRYRYGGDQSALSDSAKRGELLFSSSEKAGCFQCHGSWNFAPVHFDANHMRTSKARIPTLRNIAITAPYMHDGSAATLEDVINGYADGKFERSPQTHFVLTPAEKHDLVEFLKSLTDEELLHDPRWSNPWPLIEARP